MSAIISEPMMITTTTTTQDSTTTVTAAVGSTVGAAVDIQFARCECCGLTEECTPAYIERIRERYMGKWICGLCSEAVKHEVVQSKRLITTEEALNRHLNVCTKFRTAAPPAGGAALISAVRQILRRTLECPRGGLRSTPASPTRTSEDRPMPMLSRSGSCFPDLSS